MKPVNPADFDSRFEFSKATSNYHFDPTIVDDEADVFKRIGQFVGEWQPEIDYCLKHVRKSSNTFINRIGHPDPYTKQLDVADLERLGVDGDWVLFEKFFPSSFCKQMRAMAEFFGMESMYYNLHVQMPGQVFFYHVDNLTSLRKNQNDTSIMEDPSRAARFGVALQDWQPGHVYAYGNTYWKQWKAGDIVYHDWINTPHGTANLGHSPRVTLQITGLTTPRTLELISSKNLKISVDDLIKPI